MDAVLSCQGREGSSVGILIRLHSRLSTNHCSIPCRCRRFLSSSQLLYSLQFNGCLFPRVKPTSVTMRTCLHLGLELRICGALPPFPYIYPWRGFLIIHMEYFIILRSKTLWNFFLNTSLNVHLSIFISVFNQLDAQNLFYNKFYFMRLYVSSTCAHHQEVKIALHSLWYHHTYSCDDTRGCIMQCKWYQRLCNAILTSWWWAHVLETCRGMK